MYEDGTGAVLVEVFIDALLGACGMSLLEHYAYYSQSNSPTVVEHLSLGDDLALLLLHDAHAYEAGCEYLLEGDVHGG